MNEKAKEQLLGLFTDKNIVLRTYYGWPGPNCQNCTINPGFEYECDHKLYPDLNDYLINLVEEEEDEFQVAIFRGEDNYYEICIGNERVEARHIYDQEEDIKSLREENSFLKADKELLESFINDLQRENEVLKADIELFDSIIKDPIIAGDTRPLKIQILKLEKEVEMLKEELKIEQIKLKICYEKQKN